MLSSQLIMEKRECKLVNLVQDKVLEATNKEGEIVPLQYLHENEAMSMLGMYLAPDESNKDQLKYMHNHATSWATSIRAGVFQQNKA